MQVNNARRMRRTEGSGIFPTELRSSLTNLLIGLALTFNLQAVDIDPDGKKIKEGIEKYKQNNYYGSLENFTEAEKNLNDDPRIAFNKGTSYFKLNDWKMAQKYFEKSTNTKDNSLKAKSFYNLGNTFAKLGDKKNAIKSYMSALNTEPNFLPARKNLELLNRKENKEEQKNKEEQEENKENQKKEENKFSQNQKNNKEEKTDEVDQKKNKELSKEEAEKILDSLKEDKIKRRKSNSGNRDRNEVFW